MKNAFYSTNGLSILHSSFFILHFPSSLLKSYTIFPYEMLNIFHEMCTIFYILAFENSLILRTI